MFHDYLRCCCPPWLLNVNRKYLGNWPLALRSHVTNALFKQWVWTLLMPKIDGGHKNCLTRENWEETHLRETFYGTLIFQQSSMICFGRHVGGHTSCPLTWRPKLLFACILLNAQMCWKRFHIIFWTISLKFKCQISVQREVIRRFKNHVLATWPATNWFILRKWCGFEKLNHYCFV